MAIREPKIIEMYADGKGYGTLTREEIMEHFPEMRADEMTDGWGTACEYLSKYTDSDGLCRLDLERLVADGSDCTRDAAVSVIISTLLNVNRAENIPEEILERAMPYISARTAELEYFGIKLKKLQTFALQAVGLLSAAMESDDKLDGCFDIILRLAPSAESYAAITQRYKEWYVPLFETLHNAARLCSSQIYEEAMEEYLEAVR